MVQVLLVKSRAFSLMEMFPISNPSAGQADIEIAIDLSDIFNGALADNTLIRGDTAGDVVQDSGVFLDDFSNMTQVNSLHLNGNAAITEVLRVNGSALMNGLVKSSSFLTLQVIT